ncbi:hypothetical protein [Burkholderia sp. USMB20]|uniref:hypothetical protein n=1 Tax=Burkholderia sp. USMB20 TaxID=1571773 RepID=UPI0009E18D09|nr:hypothetical protein [Burkholderia sp. USMB20]TGN99400.1 hypothetical protein PL79_001715 [Burkholderia sp. USMB20]
MKIINDGNFAPWFRVGLWAAGIAIAATAYYLLSGLLMFFGVVVGMIVLATGTYAERANILHLKPFDNSYKKARDSYKASRSEDHDRGL